MEALLILLGSALGGMARFALAGAIARRCGPRFPWGTLAVNASGALAVGLAGAWLFAVPGDSSPMQWASAPGLVGFLGSYTTVSSFSLETLALARERRHRAAAANVALSLLLGLGLAAAGFALGLAVMPGDGAMTRVSWP